MPDFKANHWALLDLQYEYLDDGFKLTATTDVPCHLFCRMTTTPPRKHVLPSRRRGTRFTGDIRFCFVVYEDNEQVEEGDTLTHTWNKTSWPVCETRWFYFVGTQGGTTSVSETAMFKFHFPAPPPEPPPPMLRVFYAQANNRTAQGSALTWAGAHDAPAGTILGNYDAPNYAIMSGSYLRGGWHYIWRGFLSFDMSAMPAAAKILDATLSLFVFTEFGTVGKKIFITFGVQDDPIIPTNYGDQLPHTAVLGEKINLGTGAYQDIPFNDASLYLVVPGQVNRYCIRGQVDLYDENPPAVYRSYISYYSSQKGAGYRPTLSLHYYPA